MGVIDRCRSDNNEYIYRFKFVIINNHVLQRIIHDGVVVFLVKIALHFLLQISCLFSSELCET